MKYVIIPKSGFSESFEATNANEALIEFAAKMDTDMSIYFEAIPENELTQRILSDRTKAHEEFVTAFMRGVLVDDFIVTHEEADEYAPIAYDRYSLGGLTEYEAVEATYDEFLADKYAKEKCFRVTITEEFCRQIMAEGSNSREAYDSVEKAYADGNLVVIKPSEYTSPYFLSHDIEVKEQLTRDCFHVVVLERFQKDFKILAPDSETARKLAVDFYEDENVTVVPAVPDNSNLFCDFIIEVDQKEINKDEDLDWLR